MLTPWFAVSVGIVVATSMTLATPHPALSFPKPKTARCVQAGCGTQPAPSKARHPAITRGAPLPAQPDASEQSHVKVEYAAQPQEDGQFMAVIVIDSQYALKDWTLRFSLHGAHITTIMWATWQRTGLDGILVSGSPPPWPRSVANVARVVILGTGTPSWPTGCEFDGGQCAFRAMTAPAGPGGTNGHGHQHGNGPGQPGRRGR